MTSQLRVLVEQPTKGKRWVAVAADWPGLERGAKTEDEAVEKLVRYVQRYLPIAKRVQLDSELGAQTDVEIVGRYQGTGSTDPFVLELRHQARLFFAAQALLGSSGKLPVRTLRKLQEKGNGVLRGADLRATWKSELGGSATAQ